MLLGTLAIAPASSVIVGQGFARGRTAFQRPLPLPISAMPAGTVMSHRIVDGLFLATPCRKPASVPAVPKGIRGAKRYGYKYEGAFAAAMEQKFPSACMAGQWFQFNDRNGSGYCQPDLILRTAKLNIIFECKLTDVATARSQLSHLYFPVVKSALGKPVVGIVVTRHLTKETMLELVVDTLAQAVARAKEIIPTLHWRERTPL